MQPHMDNLKWDASGLLPAIIQEARTGQVLALFWMNREALTQTIQTKKVHTYSRSRKKLAMKGETSGHVQHVKEILTDCDQDVVLVKVEQVGAACHEGYFSCFFRQYKPDANRWETIAEKAVDMETLHKK